MGRTKTGVSPETITETIHLQGESSEFTNSITTMTLPPHVNTVNLRVINSLDLPAIRYIGPGTGVYFENRAIGGGNLVMVKGQPVVIGDGSRGETVAPEYAEELVAAGKAEYVALPGADVSESADSGADTETPAQAEPSAE